VSLNHKRRIFRANASRHASRQNPSFRVLLAAIGGAATVIIAASLFVGSSDAPARVGKDDLHVGADAGQTVVLDGNTLRVGDQVVRLQGIVAPPRGSTCQDAGQGTVDCGTAAANALASLVRGKAVDCAISGHDARGRPEALCTAGDRKLAEALVRDGWARAKAADLRAVEAAARADGRGIWHKGA
jgi:endonuclease YncB( thermonuclease family)